MNSKEIWAPELHFIQGKWYFIYAADDADPHPAERMLDILQNKLAIRDSKIDIDSFNKIKPHRRLNSK